jgi:hypothetical protein
VALPQILTFSQQFYAFPMFLFPPFRHDTVGSDMMSMVVGVFGWQNLTTVLIGLLVLLPIRAVWIGYENKQT